jgi:hypothetical protein
MSKITNVMSGPEEAGGRPHSGNLEFGTSLSKRLQVSA